MRKPITLFLPVILIAGCLVTAAEARQTKTARGTVSSLSGAAFTIKAGETEMKFVVDAKTVLVASGAGTAERKADAAGKPGPRLTDFVKVGDAVEVSYQEVGGAMHAVNVRRVGSAGSGSTGDERTERATGTVQSVTATSMTITGSGGGGAKFTQTFAIDVKTNVIASGAGTAAAKQQGKVNLTDFVRVGDEVSVAYRTAGKVLHADEIRVTNRKK
jgi:hypothetical protein